MKRQRKLFWFWASILNGFVKKSDVRKPKARCVIHENLVLINASSAREALRKVQKLEKFHERVGDDGLTFSGKPATRISFGISGMGVIYEKLDDGAEITFTRRYCALRKAKKMGLNQASLLRRLTKEFEVVKRCGVIAPFPPGALVARRKN